MFYKGREDWSFSDEGEVYDGTILRYCLFACCNENVFLNAIAGKTIYKNMTSKEINSILEVLSENSSLPKK